LSTICSESADTIGNILGFLHDESLLFFVILRLIYAAGHGLGAGNRIQRISLEGRLKPQNAIAIKENEKLKTQSYVSLHCTPGYSRLKAIIRSSIDFRGSAFGSAEGLMKEA
jgi:hypothetical protein